MRVAFLITSPYQLFHYQEIAPHLPDPAAVIEARAHEHGLSEQLVRERLGVRDVEEVPATRLGSLDGRYAAIVCQTPVLPLEFPERSLVVAQQYSLAKEQYQYGVWRAHAHLNLMYGDYSASRVAGFCHAVPVGNPLLDRHWHRPPPSRRPLTGGTQRPRILYMPTYGELSSLPTVLPRLRDVDAEVTIKLHHAEDSAMVDSAAAAAGFRVVGADADPVELLRTHDGVISDFSGAAFDALYAGLPVVLAGVADPHSKDVSRLSAAERDHSLLAGVAEFWRPATDLFEAFAAAEQRLATPRYDEWCKATFVNPGSAGEAAAAEIVRLLVDGPPEHFGAQQVRAATKRYIVAGRRSRVRVADGELFEQPVPARPPQPQRPGRARLAYRRTRRLLASSERLRRTVRTLRRWRQDWHARGEARRQAHDAATLDLAPAPAARREQIMRLLLAYLQAEGVTPARDHDGEGADAAVLITDRRRVLRALHRLAADRSDLQVRVGVGVEIAATLPASEVRWVDLLTAEWLEIGTVHERGTYRIGASGDAVLLFVAYDRDRNRYLSQRTRAPRTDWTPVFHARPATAAPAVAGPRRRPDIGPVDVVYTWVDSGDPQWRAAHEQYSAGTADAMPSANNSERFLNREELRYSLRTLWLFAPFVRHIYLVTADQRPPWLADHPKVTVVSHRDIFPDQDDLPTFNSHAIEACLHRIPGLADHFLYLNDDVFLGQEVTEGDFFTTAGLAKVRLSPSQFIYRGKPEPAAIPTDWAAYHSVRLVEEQFNRTFDRRVMHVPMALRRDVLAEIEQRFPEEIQRTRAARFRSRDDVAVPSMLAQFYGIASGQAVEWPTVRNEYIYLDTGRALTLYRFEEILRRRPRFFCLNATRYTQVDLADQARTIRQFLRGAFPDPAPWELSSEHEPEAATDHARASAPPAHPAHPASPAPKRGALLRP